MLFDQVTTISAPVDAVWAFVNDIDAVSKCVPGVEDLEMVSTDQYRGALRVKVGQIVVRLQGNIAIAERDGTAHRSVINLKATERRINSSLSATTTIALQGGPNGATTMQIHTEAAIFGKLGEFGQAVLRRKADQILEEFTSNLAKQLGQADQPAAPVVTVTPRVNSVQRLLAWIRRVFGHSPAVDSSQ